MFSKIVLAIGVLVISTPLFVHAQTSSERVLNFAELITVKSDASFTVQEQINYDFGVNQRHGIYRDIPVTYSTDHGKTSISLSAVSVTDESSQSYPFTIESDGNYERIKIGNPGALVSGKHEYRITYTVQRAITYFDTFDEVYWNVTGNEWQVPIDHVSAQIILPQEVQDNNLKVSCYVGVSGSTASCQHSGLLFQTQQGLTVGEGLTFAVGFPKGIVTQPTVLQTALQFLRDNGILALPIVVLIAMLTLWYKKGKDPKGRGTVVAEYESPDGLVPVEVSTLIDEKLKPKAISAEIISLAERGFLKITRLEEKHLFKNGTDYKLDLQQGVPLPESEFDKTLLNDLFDGSASVNVSDLKNTFYKKLPGLEKLVFASLIKRGYYPQSPKKVRGVYQAIGMLSIIGAFTLASLQLISDTFGAAVFISGIVILAFGYFMPKVTQQGAQIKERIKGLKLYINTAEKDRIAFHDAPEKNPELFEKLLPFAMVFGLEKKWAEEFKDIYVSHPLWYADPYATQFNSVWLASNLTSFKSAAATTFASAPRGGSGSGGGGFSGGGFGGGGGGSW